MSGVIRTNRRSRYSGYRSRSVDESIKWKVTGQDARRTYDELIRHPAPHPPLRGKPIVTDPMLLGASTHQSIAKEEPASVLPNAVFLSVEGRMKEIRDQLRALPRRQEETTHTENRSAGDLRTTLRIIAEQQDTLKKHGQVFQHRQDQITSHQEWISQHQTVREEKVNTGRLFQDKIREDMAECAREVMKVEFAQHHA